MSVAWVGAGIAAVGVVSGAVSAHNAASAQENAVNSANALSQSQYDQTRADNAPYRTEGYAALSRMSDLLGLSGNSGADGYGSLTKPFTGDSVTTDPGYQFGLKTGLTSAQNSAAAKGGLYSGATLKALTQYGNDYATTKFDDAFNRDQTTKNAVYNKLAGVSGTGQNATTQVDNAGATASANQGGNLIGAGNARGAAGVATGNALTNGLNQGGAWWLKYGSQSGAPYTTPSQFQDGTTFYGGSGTTLYGDGYGPG
jgi:hypothetical protein